MVISIDAEEAFVKLQHEMLVGDECSPSTR